MFSQCVCNLLAVAKAAVQSVDDDVKALVGPQNAVFHRSPSHWLSDAAERDSGTGTELPVSGAGDAWQIALPSRPSACFERFIHIQPIP